MRRPTRGLILASNVHVMADWQWQRAHHCLFLQQSVTSTVTPERFCHFALHRSLTKAAKCPRASGHVLSLLHMVTWPVFALISGLPTPRGPCLITHWEISAVTTSAILTILVRPPSWLDNPSRTTTWSAWVPKVPTLSAEQVLYLDTLSYWIVQCEHITQTPCSTKMA